MEFNPLTNEEKRVIEDKGTEKPFSGKYNDFYADDAMRHYFHRKQNSMPDADGQHLMRIFQTQ